MDVRDPRSSDIRTLSVALRAGERAPSVSNTRPWVLSLEAGRVVVGTDPERRLDVADPQAREQVISCGAALYNIRAALRAEGIIPEVTLLPDPERPGRLAEVGLGRESEPDLETRARAAAVARRRTHRGLFATDVNDVTLMRDLAADAATEGAALVPLTTDSLIRALAGLVASAEHLHRHERPHAFERGRWVRSAGSRANDGVRAEDFPPDADVGLFPGSDYGRPTHIRGMLDSPGEVTGTVALLTTATDTRRAWLAAGQALERVLLTSASEGVLAAFHTQPLEEPMLRAFIAERICERTHPQMIMRLGRPHPNTSRLRPARTTER